MNSVSKAADRGGAGDGAIGSNPGGRGAIKGAAPQAASIAFDLAIAPPIAKRVEHAVESANGTRNDEYYWLRDDDPKAKRAEVMDYLRAERAYTDAVMAPQAPLRESLVREMRARIKEDDSSVPQYDNGYWYWRRYDAGAEYPVYVRQRGDAAAADENAAIETLLDGVALSREHAFFSIGVMAVSPDNQWLAWTQDITGRRMSTLHIKNLGTGETLADEVAGVLEYAVWANDNRTLYYLKQDPVLLQSGPVYRHVRGTSEAADTLVYDEADKTLFTGLERSASRRWILIRIEGFDVTEVQAIELGAESAAHDPSPPRVILPRTLGVRNYADHLNSRWIFRSNDGAKNFKLVQAPESAPADRTQWHELVPGRSDATLEGFSLFDNVIALQERVDANARVRLLPWGQGSGAAKERVVLADEPAFAMELGNNPDPAAQSVRYSYSSMVTPSSVFDVDLVTGQRTLRKEQVVIGYDRGRYVSERVWAPARDGKKIPVSLAYRIDLFRRDGSAPLALIGYGAYGVCYDPYLSSNRLSLIDRGFVFAIAHVRGGAELGQDWYDDGRLMHKRNTFNDFVDVTDFLVRERYAAGERVFASGGSAGGLLTAAIANEAGAKYRGIALHVPFVDVVTTMLDESIPLTTNEWTQWGDPRERDAYHYLLSYSPYDNIAARDYPPMLITTGLWDSQVQYFEPAKFVARLRAKKTDRNPLLFHINLDAGHGGKSGGSNSSRRRRWSLRFFSPWQELRTSAFQRDEKLPHRSLRLASRSAPFSAGDPTGSEYAADLLGTR